MNCARGSVKCVSMSLPNWCHRQAFTFHEDNSESLVDADEKKTGDTSPLRYSHLHSSGVRESGVARLITDLGRGIFESLFTKATSVLYYYNNATGETR